MKHPMKHLVAAACLVVATLTPALAAETAQQQKMKDCNAQATTKQLKGNDRQTFMAQCLKAGSGDHQLTAQQQKMKDCNAQAAQQQLKGKDRKSFMSHCLSGKSSM